MNQPSTVCTESHATSPEITSHGHLERLTLAQDGFVESIARQITKNLIDIAELTEAQISGSDLSTVGSFTFLNSGGITKIQGIALLLAKPWAGRALMSWTLILPRLLTARIHTNKS